jgi:hypothetical protein
VLAQRDSDLCAERPFVLGGDSFESLGRLAIDLGGDDPFSSARYPFE